MSQQNSLTVVMILSRIYRVSKGKVGQLRTSGKSGHTLANSGNPDETAPYESSHQDFHCLLS